MFKIVNGGQLPTRATKYSACVDLYANADVTIGAGETKLIPLGVAIDLEKLKAISDRDLENQTGMSTWLINQTGDGDADVVYFDTFMASHYLQLMLRSSLSKHLIIANGVGIVDCDYTPSCKVSKKIENDLCDEFIPIDKDDDGIKCENCQNFNQNEIMIRVHCPFNNEFVQVMNEEGTGATFVNQKYEIKKGDRVAQITLLEHKSYLFGIESEEERTDGFGSSGK